MSVGDTRSIVGLGELLEILHLDDSEAVTVQSGVLTAVAGGVSCLRFRYRDVSGENSVQTMCVVAVDEIGDCSGLDPVPLDLNVHLDPGASPVGNADALVGGTLFATCRTAAGALRLTRPQVNLPDLYLMIVDALGDGPYSLGDDELEAQRNGVITAFDGTEMRAPWIVTVSREVSRLEWLEDGTIAVNREDCANTPSCTDSPKVVLPGDIFRTSLGLAPDQLSQLRDTADPSAVDEFLTSRIGIGLDEIAALHPDVLPRTFDRLAVLEILLGLLEQWDATYQLRAKQVIVGYRQPWFAERELTEFCFPDAAQQEACARIETAIAGYEQTRIAEARASGVRLWQTGSIDVDGRLPLPDRRPHWSNFEGVMAGIGDQDLGSADLRISYRDAASRLAIEVGSDTPVVLFLTGGPLEAQTAGIFCEAEVCPSDFAGAYEMAEGALIGAIEALGPDQFRGFAVGLFDGSHFDIATPYEGFGFVLNRVGETGYNHPILNVWRTGPPPR